VKDRAYFNSTRLGDQEVRGYELKARGQNMKVLEFLQANPHLVVTCEDVHNLVLPGAPETSPRRALTWLKKHGYIETVGKAMGKNWNRPIFQWQLRPPEPEQQELFNAQN
jgi:hypothetical protein